MTKIIGRRQWVTGFAVPIVTLLLAGCAANGGGAGTSDDDKASLLQRAQAYWALVRSGDNVGAWRYEEASKDPKATLRNTSSEVVWLTKLLKYAMCVASKEIVRS